MVSISNVICNASISKPPNAPPSARCEAGASRLVQPRCARQAPCALCANKLMDPRRPYNTRARLAAMLSAPLV